MSYQNHELNLPDYLPERVQRAYRQTGTQWTHRSEIQIYSFEMTEAIPQDAFEESFNVVCFNSTNPIKSIQLTWNEYDGCYIMLFNQQEDAFIELNDKENDMPTEEETYAKWLEIIHAVINGTK